MDYGLDMLAGYWIALDEYGKAYVYREVYKSNLVMSDAAQLIRSMTNEKIYAWYAPPDMWNRRQDTGRSVADVFAECGIPLTKAQNNRSQGWLDLKEWLKPTENEGGLIANLRVFRNCNNLIHSIPALLFDEHNPDDVATEPHQYTHGPDAIRYFIAGRPIPTYLPPKEDDDNIEYETQIANFLDFGR